MLAILLAGMIVTMLNQSIRSRCAPASWIVSYGSDGDLDRKAL